MFPRGPRLANLVLHKFANLTDLGLIAPALGQLKATSFGHFRNLG